VLYGDISKGDANMRTWADDFNTYQEACDYYGCDGPRELAMEAAADAERAEEEAAAFIGPKVPSEIGYVSSTGMVYRSFDHMLEVELGF
jgi:hypothetical protein